MLSWRSRRYSITAMAMPVRLVALAFLAALASSSPSLAQTVAETASKWGLLGTWKLDCAAPASGSNVALSYVVRGGRLFHDRDGGASKQYTDSNQVASARVNPDGTLEVTIPFASLSQTRQIAFIRGADGRIRVLYNKNVDTGEYSIKGGAFTSDGRLSAWQSRCLR
jgi:hypothetical protein